jgi:hypothetical protein
MATNEQHFDPRFDPAFQRGFGGAAGASAGTGTQAGRRAAPAVQQLPPPTPVDGQSAPLIGEAPASTRGPASAPPPAVRDDGLTIADAAQEPRRQWTNPFLIALAVLSVALVAAGLWMFQAAREPFLGTDANSQADYATLTMMMDLAPLLLTLGAATAIGIVFLFAIDWQKRRR